MSHQPSRGRTWALLATPLLVVATCNAALTQFDSADAWVDAVGGDHRLIGFTDLAGGEFVLDQYADLGVHFIGPPTSTTVFAIQSPDFVDGSGITSFEELLIEFEEPIDAIGFRLNGAARLDFLDEEGEAIGDLGPVIGPFVGVQTDFTFVAARLLVDLGTNVTIDDLFVGPPIPGPAGFGVLALAGVCSHRRRRP